MQPALQPLPPSLMAGGALRHGLFAGDLPRGALERLPGRGRMRSWWYAAAANEDGSVCLGAAIVTLGAVGTTFAWIADESGVREVSRRLVGRRKRVGTTPDGGATATGRDFDVAIDGRGSLSLRFAEVGGKPLRAALHTHAVSPVVCATATPGGGSNVTQKAAGHRVTGTVDNGSGETEFSGGGWMDWTRGRQDRLTTWRWAAGAGRDARGRSVGINVSTGMNGAGPTENVAWIDGNPFPIDLQFLEPVDVHRPDGGWRLGGRGWDLSFASRGARAAQENLLLVHSSYVQPIGTFRGTLPDPAGGTIDVTAMPGVTEDHEARW